MRFNLLISGLTTLLLLGGMGAAVLAQTYAVIVLKSTPPSLYLSALNEMEKAFQAREAKVTFSYYDLERDNQKARELFNSIKDRQPDLILTVGTFATQVAKDEADNLPVVFTCVLNPVASGLVPSFASPGKNFTGVSLDIPFSEQLSSFLLLVPYLKELGVLYNPKETGLLVYEAKEECRKRGIRLRDIPIGSPEDVPGKLPLLQGIDGLWMTPDSTVFTPRNSEFVLLYTLREGIPFMGISEEFVRAGALFANYPDYADIGRQTAEQIYKVLAGEKLAALPVTLPEKKYLAINLKVAKRIGLRVPEYIAKKAKVVYQ